MSTESQRIDEIISTLKTRQQTNRLNYYQPYAFQQRFHDSGREANQRLLMAANRVGKSYVGAMEMAIHLTGEYPSWWKGKRFKEPIRRVCDNTTPRASSYFEV